MATSFSKPSSPSARPRKTSAMPPTAMRSSSSYWPKLGMVRAPAIARPPPTAFGPGSLGQAMAKFKSLRTICAAAVADGVVPGLAVVVGQGGRDHFAEAFGLRQVVPVQAAASLDTVWDLASLTKALTT